MARKTYVHRVAPVMLKHKRCPHCGYDIRGLPADPSNGTSLCPECGCAWRLNGARPAGDHGDR